MLRDGDPPFRDATHGPSNTAVWLAPVEVRRAMYGRNRRHPRDHRRGLAMDVRVHKVRVHNVGTERTDLGDQRRDQEGIRVRTRVAYDDVDPGLSHVLDENVASPRPQHAHSDVKTRSFERWQETEEMPFRSSDTFDPLDVQDPLTIS